MNAESCTFYNKTDASSFRDVSRQKRRCILHPGIILVAAHALGFCSLKGIWFKCLIEPRLKIGILLCIGNDTVGAACPRLERNYRGAAGAELSVLWMSALQPQPFISSWPADGIRGLFCQPTAFAGWSLLGSLVTVRGLGGRKVQPSGQDTEREFSSFLILVKVWSDQLWGGGGGWGVVVGVLAD